MSHQRRRGQYATIWKTIATIDRRGNEVITVDEANPYLIRVWAIPQRSARAEVPGQQQINVVRIGVDPLEDVTLWSRVEWQGEMWDVAAPAAYHHGINRHTRHFSIDLRKRP